MSNKVYEIITNEIIELLEEGTIPWEKPWTNFPKNLVSGKGYRGINYFKLGIVAIRNEYKSEFWITYKQAKKLGGSVRKGEKGTHIIFWKPLVTKDEDGEIVKSFGMLRYYSVFNVEQCENLEYPEGTTRDINPIQEAISLVDGMPKPPVIKHVGGRAFYSPSQDLVTVPEHKYFKGDEEYYATLFHELVHSTGHKLFQAWNCGDQE